MEESIRTSNMRPLTIASVAMLAGVAVAMIAPSARALTVYSLTTSITYTGQTYTATYKVIDVNDDGIVTLRTSCPVRDQINTAFGTTTFAFPGSYLGTFRGYSVTLSSSDMYVLQVTC